MNASPDCVTPDHIHDWADLSPADPRAAHVAGCARCRALLGAYRDFLEAPAEGIPASELEAADSKMAAFLEREEVRTAPGPLSGLRESPARRVSGARWFWGTAAAAAVVLAVLLFRTPAIDDRAPVLRGDEPPGESAVVTDLEAERLAVGGWRLHWAAADGADSYEVQIFGADLSRLHQFTVVEPVAEIPAELEQVPNAEPGFWQVTARFGGDPIGESPLVAFPRP